MTLKLWGKNPLVEYLIGSLREVYGEIPDPRCGNNKQYRFKDIVMSAFSAFFIQLPSFLTHQNLFRKARGESAFSSLFGISQLPTDNHIRKQLDRIDCDQVYEGFDLALEQLQKYQSLRPYQALNGYTLVAYDGSQFYNSRKVYCDQCQHRVRNKDKKNQYTEYYHSVFTAALVGPDHPYAVPLRPEFITPQDGDEKQDCETKAAYRWLDKNAERYAAINPLYLGDDLYAKEPMCRKILEAGAQLIFRVKRGDHTTLFSHLDKRPWPSKTVIVKTPGTKKPNKEYRYRWTSQTLPLTAKKDPLKVYYVELRIRNVGAKDTASRFRFITSLKPNKDNVAEIVACGRCRWKIENETFNTLKNQGYHLEHCFGHGKEGLANTLLSLNLIAFAFHGVCDQLCDLWRIARNQYSRRKCFFASLRSCRTYFNNWQKLLLIIARPPP